MSHRGGKSPKIRRRRFKNVRNKRDKLDKGYALVKFRRGLFDPLGSNRDGNMSYISQVLNAPDLTDSFKLALIKKYIQEEEVKKHEQKRSYRNVYFDRYA